jgi:hypothetical protein
VRSPLITAIVLGLSAAAVAQDRRELRPGAGPWLPDMPVLVRPFQASGRAIEVTTKGLRVRVEPLDDAARATHFELRTRLGRDPFPTRDAYPPGYTVFAVSLFNGAGTQVSYSPGMGTCTDGLGRPVRLMQADQIYDLLRAVHAGHADTDQAAAAAMDAFHVRDIVLEPGQQVTRLLAFEGASAKTERILLWLDQLSIGRDELRLQFPFVNAATPAD